MNKINYQRVLEQTLEQIQVQTEQTGDAPTLLLHSCCAPCSSYVLEYLSQYFCITVFYYNPNIYPEEEYRMRVREQQEFIRRFPAKYPIRFLEGDYDTARFYEIAKGLEQLPEGGGRCFRCYEQRIGAELGVAYLCSDFKKKNGYKRSTELSKEYGMYRQDYCGCVYSYRERHGGCLDDGNCP